MTAAIASDASWDGEGLRPYDARRDMVALADLIETSFGERLDNSGRRMIREMRMLGRAGWPGWLLSRWLLPPAANPFGFVWESEGKVVGNASLLPVEHFPRRWVIANIAVSPEHRNKGIAGQLVAASIDFAYHKDARKLILQVDADNEGAISLYRRRGFEEITIRTVWRSQRGLCDLKAVDPGPVRLRRSEEWREQWALAKRLHPEGVVWPYPTSSSLFRPVGMERWFSMSRDRHWVFLEGKRIVGSLSMRLSKQPGFRRLIMFVEPEYRGRLETRLLARALGGYQDAQWSYVLEYPHEAAEQELRAMGFSPQRTLVWMVRSLQRNSSAGEC